VVCEKKGGLSADLCLDNRSRRTGRPYQLAATGEKYIPPGAIHVGVIGALAERGNGLMPLARYICKGVDPNHARRMFVTPVAQGTTIGKRSGVSRALGKTAIKKRRAAGFEKPNRRRQS
jgi:hypothetical protein